MGGVGCGVFVCVCVHIYIYIYILGISLAVRTTKREAHPAAATTGAPCEHLEVVAWD